MYARARFCHLHNFPSQVFCPFVLQYGFSGKEEEMEKGEVMSETACFVLSFSELIFSCVASHQQISCVQIVMTAVSITT